jgi:TIR domain
MQTSHQTQVTLVGPESMENLRLADVLRRLVGRANFFRHLETEHLLTFLREHAETPLVVFVDLFSFNLERVTEVIGEVRHRNPRVVFSLYMDPDSWRTRRAELPGEWSARLGHYYHLFKVPNDEDFEPIVRQALKEASREAEYNFGHEPIRMTNHFDAGVVAPDPSPEVRPLSEETVFVSYSRSDWDHAVSDLVVRLRRGGFQLWVDQGFLIGGEDWMDAIGEALKKCNVCLLVISPDAMQSRYVKMEYRFFFNNEKPIAPVMVKPVAELPPELTGIHYLDFTVEAASNYDELNRVLARCSQA